MKKIMETSLTPLPKLALFVGGGGGGGVDAGEADGAESTNTDASNNKSCEELIKRSDALKKEIISLSVPKIPDISRRKPATELSGAHHSPLQQYYDRVDRLLRLHSDTSQLRVDVTNELSTKVE